MTLGGLQNLTMLAVARLGAHAWTGEIRDELRRVAERDVSVSSVFVTLTRLEDQGLLESRRGSRPPRGGRARRVFSLTEAGWAELRETREASERMWAGLEGGG